MKKGRKKIKAEKYNFTDHALFEMRRRRISEEEVKEVLSNPEQNIRVQPGRMVMQSRIRKGKIPRLFLLRVVVDIDRKPAEVVTAYITSKTEKYWERNHESNLR